MSELLARVTSHDAASPGPAAYQTDYKIGSESPSFTIKGRHETISRPVTAPYRALPSTIGQGPKFTMTSRHKDRDISTTPGPNYEPPAFGSDAKKISMSYRHSEVRDSRADNPGPGAYDVQPKFAKEATAYTLKGRTKNQWESESISPGPAAYSPDYSKVRKSAPSPTMHIRPQQRTVEETPGYVDLGSTLSGPKYTIGNRETLDVCRIK